MLIQCPECELQVSDKALSCPHCGYPFVKPERSFRPSSKRKRLPNGFGRITEIKNKNLRNRFRVCITTGIDNEGRYLYKILKPKGYFATYNEAYEALVEYHKNPYDLENDIKVGELYDKWLTQYSETIKNDSYLRGIKSAWARCESISNMRVADIRPRHIKGCMDLADSPNIKARIKSIMNLMLDYALEYEIVTVNYARTFDVSDGVLQEINEQKVDHIPFTEEEMNILWDNIDEPYVNIILFQCYTGMRPQELGLIEMGNVDLDNNIFVGGMKTEAGINRIIPIHPKIQPIVQALYNEAASLDSKYLINCTDTCTHHTSSYKMTYEKYKYRFNKVIVALNLNKAHRPHDPRKHFITMAKKYNLDQFAIKYIVGHKITDITEATYTAREPKWLYEEVCKIEGPQ